MHHLYKSFKLFIFFVEINNSVFIKQHYNKKTLTLITCTHDDLTKQSIYIFEQTNE